MVDVIGREELDEEEVRKAEKKEKKKAKTHLLARSPACTPTRLHVHTCAHTALAARVAGPWAIALAHGGPCCRAMGYSP